MGLTTSHDLIKKGAHVIMICRDSPHLKKAYNSIAKDATRKAPEILIADLSSQQDIHNVAKILNKKFNHIDVLINNAGAAFSERELTIDKIEKTFATNHLAPFLLTNLLIKLLIAAPAGRIVTVASGVHSSSIDFDNLQGEKSYSAMEAYNQSKLENIIFTYDLSRRLKNTKVTSNCVAPGLVSSEFGKKAGGFIGFMSWIFTPFAATPEEGAKTTIYLSSSAEVEGISGKYFVKGKEANSKLISYDVQVADKLWNISEGLTNTTFSSENFN